MEKLWREMKDWRKHWKLSRFFQVLIFGLAASLFDSGTDFNFVWNVPEECHVGNITECDFDFDFAQVNSPCGMFHYKCVESLAYTYIATTSPSLDFSLASPPFRIWSHHWSASAGKERCTEASDG